MGINLDHLSRDEISHIIDQYVHHERNRAIIKRRLLDGILMEASAEEFNLSTRQIQNIIYKSEKAIFKHIFFT